MSMALISGVSIDALPATSVLAMVPPVNSVTATLARPGLARARQIPGHTGPGCSRVERQLRPETSLAMSGANWTFPSDAGRKVQKDLDVQEYTDPSTTR